MEKLMGIIFALKMSLKYYKKLKSRLLIQESMKELFLC